MCLLVCACRSTQIKTYSWDNAQVVLAGNKCDMEEERVVSVDSGRLLAEQLGKTAASTSMSSSGLRPKTWTKSNLFTGTHRHSKLNF